MEGGDLSQMEPKLARRLSVQRQKVTAVEGAPEDAAEGSGGGTPPGPEGAPAGPGAEIADPKLARRMAQQRDKVLRGTSAVDGVGSTAERVARIDPGLLERLTAQQRKAAAGEGGAAAGLSARLEKRSTDSYSMVKNELAEKLSRRRQKEEAAQGRKPEEAQQQGPENPQSGEAAALPESGAVLAQEGEEKEEKALGQPTGAQGAPEAAAAQEESQSAEEAAEGRGPRPAEEAARREEGEESEGRDVGSSNTSSAAGVRAGGGVRQEAAEKAAGARKVPSPWRRLGAALWRCCG